MAPSVMELRPGKIKHCKTQSQSQALQKDSEITYVIPDIKVLEHICEKDQTYEVVSITGFEIYIVEQWATDRKYATVITAYTGDSEHVITAAKITLPADASKRSDHMNHFFREIDSYGGKPKTTEHGLLFITNLAKFPSNLNLVPVIGGCINDVWNSFKVSLDLRKLNCGGRSALLLCSPSDVSEDKFRQIYKTHPKVDIMYSVEELVKLVQICLVDFKLLDPSFVDGLFCNHTEESISKWWLIYGQKYYGISSPNDGKLGPITVSAILGFVLSCTFRLNLAGCDIPKEPFNYFSFRVNAGKFQKQYNLNKTWYLDPLTVTKLFTVTDKKAEVSGLKKVVKNTVKDLSKKTGTIQCAQEVMTTDIEKATKYFTCSARLEYLWSGKGDVNRIKRFDYTLLSQTTRQQLHNQTVSLRGKIKNLPKKLQDDTLKDNLFNEISSSPNVTDHELSEEDTTGDDAYNSGNNSSPYKAGGVLNDVSFDEDEQNEQRSEKIKAENIIRSRRFDYPQVFQNFNRRASYPYIATEVAVDKLSYENHDESVLFQPVQNQISIKRNKSFSFVEDAIFEWQNETPDPIYLSKRLFSIEKKIRDTKNLNHKELLAPYRSKISQKSQQVRRLKHRTTPVFHRFEIQKQEDERITTKIDDIEAIGARLEYEIRILQNKIRDTEDAVNSFAMKVEALESSINEQLLRCEHDETNQSWIQRLVKEDGVVRALVKKIETMSVFKWMANYQHGTSTLNELETITTCGTKS